MKFITILGIRSVGANIYICPISCFLASNLNLTRKVFISGIEDGKKYTDNYSVTISSDGKTMTWIDYDGGYETILKKK